MHFEAGYVPAHSVEDFAQAIRAIGEPIHQRKADEISMAKVLTLLFDVTALFDMSTRTELVMLQKTMVVVEGVARSLDPKLDMWTTAERWCARGSPTISAHRPAQSGAEALRTLSDVVTDFPDLAVRLKRVLCGSMRPARGTRRGSNASPATSAFAPFGRRSPCGASPSAR